MNPVILFRTMNGSVATGKRRAVCEALESRRHFDVTVSLTAGGDLVVQGDANPNSITVSLNGDGMIVVTPDPTGAGPFELGRVNKIVINGEGGNDTIVISIDINKPSRINGHAGEDVL